MTKNKSSGVYSVRLAPLISEKLKAIASFIGKDTNENDILKKLAEQANNMIIEAGDYGCSKEHYQFHWERLRQNKASNASWSPGEWFFLINATYSAYQYSNVQKVDSKMVIIAFDCFVNLWEALGFPDEQYFLGNLSRWGSDITNREGVLSDFRTQLNQTYCDAAQGDILFRSIVGLLQIFGDTPTAQPLHYFFAPMADVVLKAAARKFVIDFKSQIQTTYSNMDGSRAYRTESVKHGPFSLKGILSDDGTISVGLHIDEGINISHGMNFDSYLNFQRAIITRSRAGNFEAIQLDENDDVCFLLDKATRIHLTHIQADMICTLCAELDAKWPKHVQNSQIHYGYL